MAHLTTAQATEIYQNGKLEKVSKNDSFACYLLYYNLDGHRYEVDTTKEGLGLDENSTPQEIKDAIIAHLETQNHKGVKAIFDFEEVNKL